MVAGTIIAFFFWIVVWIVCSVGRGVQDIKKQKKYKEHLAPNGYALEYKIGSQLASEIYHKLNALEGTLGKEAAMDEIRKEIIQRSAAYPTIQRYLDKSGLGTWDMMRNYAAFVARAETVKAGRHPMVTGGIDPTPLPDDDSYMILKGETPLPQFDWFVFYEERYKNYLRQDEASEREYERRMAELT